MKLFARLLLWFLAANALTAVVVLLLSTWFVGVIYSQSDADRDGRTAVSIYEHEGSDALSRWLKEQRQTRSIIGMLLDADGRPLAMPPRRGAPDAAHPPQATPFTPPPPMFGAGPAGANGFPGLGPRSRSVSLTGSAGTRYRWNGLKLPPRGPTALLLDASLRLLVSLLIIGTAAWLVARRFATPVRELDRAHRALAAGHLDTRVDRALLSRSDELGSLASSFNDMAERIGKLLESHKQLLRDVSHELRTPLARLRLAAELARGTSAPRHFDRIEEEAALLAGLIGQILLLARFDVPHADHPAEPFALSDVLRDVCIRARLEASARGVRIDMAIADNARMSGRVDRIRSALENILRNAIHHTAEGSTVSVGLVSRGTEHVIAACDRGPGVPEDKLQAIFRPFVRLSRSRSRTREGGSVGLGLTIAEAAIRSDGGSISARNRSDGGLCLEVIVPASSVMYRVTQL